ncbi:MAG: guanylate kinase [Chromatiales bacterium]|nr:guanylate kinase [Chromatiales bacterium]
MVLSAPSGAGKTTLVRALMRARPEVRFSISYTTRPPRPGEIDGVDYHFVKPEDFTRMIGQHAFLEHARVFDQHYGTSRSQVDALLAAGHDVLLEIDWQGARQIRANAPECCTVFIMPPSIGELERRLRGRGTDSEDVIGRRLGQALEDMGHWAEFDHVIINERLEDAVESLLAILGGEGRQTQSSEPGLQERVAAVLRDAPG